MKEKQEGKPVAPRKLCDWCSLPEEPIPAVVRVTYTNLDGVVIDSTYLCEECKKRGAMLRGSLIDSAD